MRSTTSSSGTCSSNHVVAGLQTRSFSSIIAAAFRGLACSAGLSPALWGVPTVPVGKPGTFILYSFSVVAPPSCRIP